MIFLVWYIHNEAAESSPIELGERGDDDLPTPVIPAILSCYFIKHKTLVVITTNIPVNRLVR
jgi:hypothetical protein